MLRNPAPVLIAALSGRALARSACAAMIPAAVLDVFCDEDTLMWADTADHIGGVSGGIDFGRLPELADSICPPRRCAGLVYGAGFESAPEALAVLSEGRELHGNHPEVLADICTPSRFFAALERLGVPFPDVCFQRPLNPAGWLAKRAGASGGAHVRPLRRAGGQTGYYYQRKARGQALSVLFLASGHAAEIVGVSEQWHAGAVCAPYAYGGAVSHRRVSESLYRDFKQLVDSLTLEWRLLGLNGVDLVVDGDDFKVLEVNARPTATAELYDCGGNEGLFKRHLAACDGVLSRGRSCKRVYAHRLVYAEHDLYVTRPGWPDWCSDRPAAGTFIRGGEPLCTIHAGGANRSAVDSIVRRRSRFMRRVAAGLRPARAA